MQVEAALLCMVAAQEQTHKMLYGAEGGRPARGVGMGGGGGGGKRHCTLVCIYRNNKTCIYPAGRVSSCRGASPF